MKFLLNNLIILQKQKLCRVEKQNVDKITMVFFSFNIYDNNDIEI
jgi:hypothetical protein